MWGDQPMPPELELEYGLPIPIPYYPSDYARDALSVKSYPPRFGPGVLVPWRTWKWAGTAVYKWDAEVWQEYLANGMRSSGEWIAMHSEGPRLCLPGDIELDGSTHRHSGEAKATYPLAYYHLNSQALFPGPRLATGTWDSHDVVNERAGSVSSGSSI